MWFLLLCIDYFRVCCLISTYLWMYQISFCYWFLISFCCGWRKYFVWCQYFLKSYWGLFCGLICDFFWRMFHAYLKECVFSCCWVGLPYVSARCSWFIMFFKSSIFLFIYCLVVLFIVESGSLKYPSIIVKLSISSFNSASFASYILGAVLLDAYMFIIVKATWWIELSYHYIMSFLVSCNNFCLNVYFVWYSYNHFRSWLCLHGISFFHPFTFNILVSACKGSVLKMVYSWIIF